MKYKIKRRRRTKIHGVFGKVKRVGYGLDGLSLAELLQRALGDKDVHQVASILVNRYGSERNVIQNGTPVTALNGKQYAGYKVRFWDPRVMRTRDSECPKGLGDCL